MDATGPTELTGLLVLPETADRRAVAELLAALPGRGLQVGKEVGGVVAVTGAPASLRALESSAQVAADPASVTRDGADEQLLGLLRRSQAGFAWDEGAELHP